MDRLEVHLSPGYRRIMVFTGILTLGISALWMWLTARSWPRVLDGEGIVLRNGRRVRWEDLTEVRRVTAVDDLGRRVTGRLDLIFGKTRVPIVPHSLAEGEEVLAFLSRILGREVQPG